MNLTLDKGLKVLECLAVGAEPMAVHEIASRTGVPSPTAFRMLETLKRHGYVRQHGRRGDYRVGLRALELSAGILARMTLRRKAGPYLHELSEKTGCDAYLAAPNNGRAVIVMVNHPRGRMQVMFNAIGHVNDCHCTATGKLIAAHLPEKELAALLCDHKMERRTRSTITNRKQLLAEFKRIRTSGLARSKYENSDDVFGIAVAVQNSEGMVVGALGLAVSRKQEKKSGMARYEQALRETGERISFAIGYAADRLI